ncbi:hypothetical protein LV457_12025 [Mycobacterium sp. MYCO198283]|uniref:hypothetical protein n=1 Tax=Mycobacterium sp. MYCO198283 TaxID=2883505 RepID=UPI001E5D7C9F|nr:hypothetical protein [Mycobacterium sp. MYCO198283]MCG5433009.1 hypothetical protein [Mycobacterium sp. MYCO198283]
MTTHPFGGDPAGNQSSWTSAGAAYNRSQLMAAMRALVIALVLLGVLAVVVLF